MSSFLAQYVDLDGIEARWNGDIETVVVRFSGQSHAHLSWEDAEQLHRVLGEVLTKGRPAAEDDGTANPEDPDATRDRDIADEMGAL